MKQPLCAYFGKGGAMLLMTVLTGCAVNSQPIALAPVGPGRIPCQMGSLPGYLKVYTATEEHNDGDVMYYPHTEYTIYDPSGHFVKTVLNHCGINDEDPATATLPSGHYMVVANSETDGRVKIPVTIGEARTTVINLEGNRGRGADAVSPAEGVKTPSGQIVGWRASS